MLKRNKTVNFSTPESVYGKPSFLYFPKQQKGPQSITLPDFIKFIQNKSIPVETEWYGTLAGYAQDQIQWNLDLSKFKKIASQSNFNSMLKFKLGTYLSNDQFMMLDIIHSNIYSRPVYFAAASDLFADYLQSNGLVSQFLPLDTSKKERTEKISALKIKSFLQQRYKATPSNNLGSGLVADYSQDGNAYYMYTTVARYYLNQNKKDSADYFIDALLKAYNKDLPFTTNLMDVATALIDAGRTSEGHAILLQQIETMFNLYKNPSASYPYMSRKTVLNTAINAQTICEFKNLDRKRLDEIVSYLKKQDY